jgi:hypothetical protein
LTLFAGRGVSVCWSLHIGKAGSQVFLEAVEMMKRRTKVESLQQVRHTLELALVDLIDEATKDSNS